MSLRKAQVLIVTLFILGSSMIVTFILFMPVISQSLKMRSLLNGFQALANAESGIEVGNYYALKGVTVDPIRGGGRRMVSGMQRDYMTRCHEFTSGFLYCTRFVTEENYMRYMGFKSYVDIAIERMEPIEIKGYRNISQGVHRGTARILQFIFTTQ